MKNFFLTGIFCIVCSIQLGSRAEQLQETQNATSGNKQSFSVTLTQTHGVTSSVTMTPDYIVSTKANVVVGAGSETNQQSLKGATASLINDDPQNLHGLNADGVSGSTIIKYDQGTEYGITIAPRITDPKDNSWKEMPLSQASGQVLGITTTTLTVDSPSSAFINSFTNTLRN